MLAMRQFLNAPGQLPINAVPDTGSPRWTQV